MELEVIRYRVDALTQASESRLRNRRLDYCVEFVSITTPVYRVLITDQAETFFVGAAPGINAVSIRLRHRREFLSSNDAAFYKSRAVQSSNTQVPLYRLIHDGLSRRWLVRLVVAQSPIADQVDHDILVKCLPVAQRQSYRRDDSLGIIPVNMQDRRFDHLRDIRAIRGRPRVPQIVRREPDLIVDDDVNRAARVEIPGLRELEGLGNNALPRDCRIAMNQHG